MNANLIEYPFKNLDPTQKIEDKIIPENGLGFIHTQSQFRCDETIRL